ncbi:MAG: hypothetical protein V1725_07925 [archaeon]
MTFINKIAGVFFLALGAVLGVLLLGLYSMDFPFDLTMIAAIILIIFEVYLLIMLASERYAHGEVMPAGRTVLRIIIMLPAAAYLVLLLFEMPSIVPLALCAAILLEGLLRLL